MTYARIDDTIYAHPKIASLSDRAFRAHITAICYCSHYLTDGYVSKTAAKRLQIRPQTIAKLMQNGLWDASQTRAKREPNDRESESFDGWFIHDYGQYQESKAAVRAKRGQRDDALLARAGAPASAPGRAAALTTTTTTTANREVTSVEPLPSVESQHSQPPRAAADDPDRWKLHDTEAFALTVLNIFNETFGTTWGASDRALRPIVQALGAYPHTKDEAMQRRICEHVLGGEAWWEKDRPGTRPGTGVVYAGAQYERHLHDLGLATAEVDEGVTQPWVDKLIEWAIADGATPEEAVARLRDTKLAPGVVLPAANGGKLAAPTPPMEGTR